MGITTNIQTYTQGLTPGDLDQFKIQYIVHPETEDQVEQITYFTFNLNTLNRIIRNIRRTIEEGYDWELQTNIFYNCDDQNYSITITILTF